VSHPRAPRWLSGDGSGRVHAGAARRGDDSTTRGDKAARGDVRSGNFGEKFPDEWGPPGSAGRERKLEQAGFALWVGPIDGFG
jgi:hypothetical protein